ncbi:hypothetical protein [Flocculibacter collagenilyticus]|uniref:hypothetical protein n=1 Tax=Flocculibacter collagenilyticus TaxID=2744479 RepID=UPI0018F73A71|nr:hypothetical protein [Flocculibacter collagenilyticus]
MNKLLFICSFIFAAHAWCEVDLKFFDAAKKEYLLSTVQNDFAKEFNVALQPNVIIIKTNTVSNPAYIAQMGILNKEIDAENMQLLYISVCQDNKCNGGYHTDMQELEKLIDNESDFAVILVDDERKVLGSFSHLITANKIKKLYDM